MARASWVRSSLRTTSWCADNDVVAVSNLAFHKAVPLDKERKSGRLYYLGVRLASAKGCLRIAVDNTPRRALGRMTHAS